MWKTIPKYQNYQFNTETLEVRSLERYIKHWRGGKSIRRGRTLKPNLAKDGYYYFTLLNRYGSKNFKRSQICWLVNSGSLPPKHLRIDHIDGDITNDLFNNLQLLTHRKNIAKGYKDKGRELPTGVYWRADAGKYVSTIWGNNKKHHLGYFKSVQEASRAYQNAAQKLN